MGNQTLTEEGLKVLFDIADEMHPQGSTHQHELMRRVYVGDPLAIDDIFDLGKYYDRMLNYVGDDVNKLMPILTLKSMIHAHKNIKVYETKTK